MLLPALDLLERQTAPLLRHIFSLLSAAVSPCYLVGGMLRDLLLSGIESPTAAPPAQEDVTQVAGSVPGTGHTPDWSDLDFSVPADGLRIARQLANQLGGAFYALDPQRDVGRVVLRDPTRVIDIARFQGNTLEADLAARDFTVNAMAVDITHHPLRLIDPLAGYADLLMRHLRAVSEEAIERDPVRALRAVRLQAQLNFEIEATTRQLIRNAANQLVRTSAERVRDEVMKILALPHAASSLRELDALGLLDVVIPELTPLKGMRQTSCHRWDGFEHTLRTVAALEDWLAAGIQAGQPELPFRQLVLQHLAAETAGGYRRRTLLSLAALLHDIGKPSCASLDPDGHIRFIGHEQIGAGLAVEVLERLRLPRQAIRLVETVIRHHLRPLSLARQGIPSRRATHRYYRELGEAGVEVALHALADLQATVGPPDGDEQWPALLSTVTWLLDVYFNQHRQIVAPPPLLTGHDLVQHMGLKPGPRLGQLLADLQEAQAIGAVTTRAQAEAWVRARCGPETIEERQSEGGEQGR